MNRDIAKLEVELNAFDPGVRRRTLGKLANLWPKGEVTCEAEADVANMHCHTFFSFNAYGHSPTALAWLARRCSWRAVGIVDFDVLDGVEEFLSACDVVAVRGAAGVETRVYVPEFATREINSPGEPGIAYHMGIGFTAGQAPPDVAGTLAGLRERAARRNRDMLARINAYLDPVTLDYERDVLPLSPAGNPTERHMLVAYLRAARRLPDAARFWSERLRAPLEEVRALLGDDAQLQNLIRARLMKRGGVGYVQPGPGSFPAAGEFHRLIVGCGALPCVAWLDGTSPGEQAGEELFEFWLSQGVAALSIIPDRNWNIPDPEMRRLKVLKLHEVARLAARLDLPILAGTEMNSPGQKLIDDFAVPELAPLRGAFMDGAYFAYGHTALQRAYCLGYGSAWARTHLPTRRERNAFYAQVGRLLSPGSAWERRHPALAPNAEPAEVLCLLA